MAQENKSAKADDPKDATPSRTLQVDLGAPAVLTELAKVVGPLQLFLAQLREGAEALTRALSHDYAKDPSAASSTDGVTPKSDDKTEPPKAADGGGGGGGVRASGTEAPAKATAPEAEQPATAGPAASKRAAGSAAQGAVYALAILISAIGVFILHNVDNNTASIDQNVKQLVEQPVSEGVQVENGNVSETNPVAQPQQQVATSTNKCECNHQCGLAQAPSASTPQEQSVLPATPANHEAPVVEGGRYADGTVWVAASCSHTMSASARTGSSSRTLERPVEGRRYQTDGGRPVAASFASSPRR